MKTLDVNLEMDSQICLVIDADRKFAEDPELWRIRYFLLEPCFANSHNKDRPVEVFHRTDDKPS